MVIVRSLWVVFLVTVSYGYVSAIPVFSKSEFCFYVAKNGTSGRLLRFGEKVSFTKIPIEYAPHSQHLGDPFETAKKEIYGQFFDLPEVQDHLGNEIAKLAIIRTEKESQYSCLKVPKSPFVLGKGIEPLARVAIGNETNILQIWVSNYYFENLSFEDKTHLIKIAAFNAFIVKGHFGMHSDIFFSRMDSLILAGQTLYESLPAINAGKDILKLLRQRFPEFNYFDSKRKRIFSFGDCFKNRYFADRIYFDPENKVYTKYSVLCYKTRSELASINSVCNSLANSTRFIEGVFFDKYLNFFSVMRKKISDAYLNLFHSIVFDGNVTFSVVNWIQKSVQIISGDPLFSDFLYGLDALKVKTKVPCSVYNPLRINVCATKSSNNVSDTAIFPGGGVVSRFVDLKFENMIGDQVRRIQIDSEISIKEFGFYADKIKKSYDLLKSLEFRCSFDPSYLVLFRNIEVVDGEN